MVCRIMAVVDGGDDGSGGDNGDDGGGGDNGNGGGGDAALADGGE